MTTVAERASQTGSPPDDAARVVQPIRALLPLALAQRRLFAWTVVAGLCYHVASIAAVAFGAWVVGEAATGRAPAELTPFLVLLAASVLVAAAARWWQMWVAHDFAYSLLAILRVRAFEALARIAPRWLLGRRTGDLAGVVMSDVEVTERFYAHTVADYLVAVTVTVAATIVIGLLHPALAVALAPFVLVVGTVPYWLGKQASAQGERLRNELGALNAEIIDGVQGLRELVAFGQARSYARRLARRTTSFQVLQLAYGRRAGAEQAAADGLQTLGMLAVLATAASLVGTGGLALSLYPAAVILAVYALVPLAEVTQTARELGQIRGSARRVFTVLDHPPAVVDRAGAAPPTPDRWAVAFCDVRFRYAPDREEALAGVSFHIESGETVALVGHSGSGKSTCANLLLRFWDPDTGAVMLGGTDLRDWPAEAVREHVALVPQDVYLFNVSIYENIRLGRPDATHTEIEAAARQAFAHDFIVGELPDGYDTVCGERGAQLSGGQRQRIAIARALLADAPVLIMDEAVSNLDAANEQALQAAMAEAARGRTTLLIAHRLSTIRSADRLIVLQNGSVAETGTHDQLVAAAGAYAALITGQRAGLVGM
ncbi:MAG: ABC transporter ATP-binding protein [Egibacteraceae bacterium]